MPANMVIIAYYDPHNKNQIDQLPSEMLLRGVLSATNYGGIGAVIAHEISHAFDTNGASFDEHGSLKDWWKPEDYEAFTARTQKGHRSI